MKVILKSSVLLISSLFILSACSQSQSSNNSNSSNNNFLQKNNRSNIPAQIQGHEKGKASFYADKYQGRQTANGERFNQNARTAAHKTLKFGTWVKVTNLQNGRNVIVRINDRGPFIKGRIIDLSKSSFNAIANERLGVVDVVVEVLR